MKGAIGQSRWISTLSQARDNNHSYVGDSAGRLSRFTTANIRNATQPLSTKKVAILLRKSKLSYHFVAKDGVNLLSIMRKSYVIGVPVVLIYC